MHPDNTVVVQVRTSRNATAEEEEEATEEATEATEACCRINFTIIDTRKRYKSVTLFFSLNYLDSLF